MFKRLPFLFFFIVLVKISSAQSIMDVRTDFFVTNSTIVDALNKLTKETDISIAFSAHFFKNTAKISLRCKNKSIGFILENILSKTSIHAKTLGNQVILFRGKPRKIRHFTISGYVKDVDTKEKLIATSVFSIVGKKGTVCNEYGFFSLTLPEGKTQLSFRYLGYQEYFKTFDLTEDVHLEVSLSPYLILSEVVVKPKRNDQNAIPLAGGGQEVFRRDMENTPDVGGESDIAQTLQLMAGVESGDGGAGSLLVRGGDPGQNLVVLDGVPVYNPFHLSGLFSIFNSDVIRSTKLLTGSFPARYGGRASSVLDIRSRDGNRQQWKVVGGLSLITGKLSIEGPFLHKKGSILIAGRMTHNDILFDKIFSPIRIEFGNQSNYRFYDFNVKVNYTFSFKNRLFFSFYTGDDLFSNLLTTTFDLIEGVVKEEEEVFKNWGNSLYSLRWNHVINDKLFLNVTIIRSNYTFTNNLTKRVVSANQDNYNFFNTRSNIFDNSLFLDFNFHPNPSHSIRLGLGRTYHQFTPFVFKLNQDVSGLPIDSIKIEILNDRMRNFFFFEGVEKYAYVEDVYKPSSEWTFNFGLRLSSFKEKTKKFLGLSPRLSARYQINANLAAHASVGKMVQYLHLVSPQSFSRAEDIWLPATANLAPQKTWHSSTGVIYNLSKESEISTEFYYKKMTNLVMLSGLEDSILIDDPSDFITGKGWAYGAEFSIKKSFGKTGGWFNYSLAWAKRKFAALNEGKTFYANYDRRHNFKIFFYHRFSERFEFSTSFVYGTPNPKLFLNEKPNFRFTKKEYERSTAYHKLNVSVNWHLGKKFKHDIKLGISNVYNRQNTAFYVYFPSEPLFPVVRLSALPSLSYQLKF